MSLRILVHCNGRLGNRECRNTLRIDPLMSPAKARAKLAEYGWSHNEDGEFCEPCSRRRATILARQS